MSILSISNLFQKTKPTDAEEYRQSIFNRLIRGRFSGYNDKTYYFKIPAQFPENSATLVALPTPLLSFTESNRKKHYLSIATRIDKAINIYKQFINVSDISDVSISYNAADKIVHIHLSKKENAYDYLFSEKYDNLDPYIKERWQNTIAFETHVKVSSTGIKTRLQLQDNLRDVAFQLLGTKARNKFTFTCFNTLLNELEDAIDQIFIQHGIEPSLKKRLNLISLMVELKEELLQTPEINNLLKIGLLGHTILNPNLIKAADMGCDGMLIKSFYANEIYPSNMEELKEYASIPIEMLHGIWGMGR